MKIIFISGAKKENNFNMMLNLLQYLNSGDGCLAGFFLHEKHKDNTFPKLKGWWGHRIDTRFKMDNGRNSMYSINSVFSINSMYSINSMCSIKSMCCINNIDSINSMYSICLLYTSPSPRDLSTSRMPSSA